MIELDRLEDGRGLQACIQVEASMTRRTHTRQKPGGPLGRLHLRSRMAVMSTALDLRGAAGMRLGGESSRNLFELRWPGGPKDDENPKVMTEIIRSQYLDMLRGRSFHTTIRITNRTMRILRAKRYSFAPAMLKPERESPSIPTVEMLSPLEIYAIH